MSLPPEPPRRTQLGFLYLPPYRVQGISIAGEESVVMVPELGVCFDIGRCPRAALASNFVALTHGHMDHSAGLAYYFSQRTFQGMGVGAVICHPALEKPIHNVMQAWVDLEAQQTPYQVIPLEPDAELEIKNNIFLRAFATAHTVPSLGYVVVEKRKKLKPELAGLTQEQIRERTQRGEDVSHLVEIPLVCYTGDTCWSSCFDRPDLLSARILITECTFLEKEHRDRAAVGKHLHLDDVVRLVERSKAEAIVLVHMSRRTNMGEARKAVEAALTPAQRQRVHLLMDSRTNRMRREEQLRETDEPETDA